MWTAFASTAITSSMFLTSLAPNLLALNLVRQATALEFTWSQWALGFLPVGLLLLATLPKLVHWIYPPEIRSSPEVAAWAEVELSRSGRLTGKEWVMILAILLAFVLWVFAAERINPTTVILAVVAVLLLVRVLDWDDIVGNRGAGTRCSISRPLPRSRMG